MHRVQRYTVHHDGRSNARADDNTYIGAHCNANNDSNQVAHGPPHISTDYEPDNNPHCESHAATNDNTNARAHRRASRFADDSAHIVAYCCANYLTDNDPDDRTDAQPHRSTNARAHRHANRFTDESTYREANHHSYIPPVHRWKPQLRPDVDILRSQRQHVLLRLSPRLSSTHWMHRVQRYTVHHDGRSNARANDSTLDHGSHCNAGRADNRGSAGSQRSAGQGERWSRWQR
jgi:hypothetical protein